MHDTLITQQNNARTSMTAVVHDKAIHYSLHVIAFSLGDFLCVLLCPASVPLQSYTAVTMQAFLSTLESKQHIIHTGILVQPCSVGTTVIANQTKSDCSS